MIYKFLHAFALLSMFIAASCSNGAKVEIIDTPENLLLIKGDKVSPEKIVAANNQLAFALFNKILEANNDDNLFISPFSVATAMSMVYAGSANDTESQISSYFHWGSNEEMVHQSFSILLKQLLDNGKNPNFTLKIANKLYVDKGLTLYSQFAKINEETYNAPVQSIDFTKQEEAASNINNWVSKQTEKMIPELLKPDVLAGAKTVLVNAIYFYGAWANPFTAENTEKDTFWLEDETPIIMDFMHKYEAVNELETPYLYRENEVFQVLSLPYAKDKGSMIIFLPKKNKTYKGLNAAIANLDAAAIQTILDSLETINGELQLKLPKWEQRSHLDLVTAFKALGLEAPFDIEKADFSRITKDASLYISNIIHEAVVEVSEKGTKAAAATAVITKETMASPEEEPKRIEFMANRPFFYLIQDRETKTILFMGIHKKA